MPKKRIESVKYINFWASQKFYELLLDIKKKGIPYKRFIVASVEYVFDKWRKGELDVKKVDKKKWKVVENAQEKPEIEKKETQHRPSRKRRPKKREEEKPEPEVKEETKEGAEESEIKIEEEVEEKPAIVERYTNEEIEKFKPKVIEFLKEQGGATDIDTLSKHLERSKSWLTWLLSNLMLDEIVVVKGKEVVLKGGMKNVD